MFKERKGKKCTEIGFWMRMAIERRKKDLLRVSKAYKMNMRDRMAKEEE